MNPVTECNGAARIRFVLLAALISTTTFAADNLPAEELQALVIRHLTNPPSIVDARFSHETGKGAVKFYRAAWAPTGFFLAESDKVGDLEHLTNLKIIHGRAANIAWRTGGGVLTVANTNTENESVVIQNIGNLAAYERLAFTPLSFGILPIRTDKTLRFEGNTFEGLDFKGSTLYGEVLPEPDGGVIVEYAITQIKNWKYRSHVHNRDKALPLPVWSYTLAMGPGETNRIGANYSLISCQISEETLPPGYFHPTNLLEKSHIPLVIGVIKNNEMVSLSNGQVTVSSSIGKQSGLKRQTISLLILISVGALLTALSSALLVRQKKARLAAAKTM